MIPSRSVLRLFAVLLLVPASAPPTPAQEVPGTPAGPEVSREGMWPAPTAADWQRPCLITWQRSFDDAVAVARETNRPILVCINMDGEIASEHYAGIRYRQQDVASLYQPYVCVIASVYRHTPRDYDDRGERIPCPRFGTVTCGEHIAIEPMLYEKFMDGRRIAPRHIMVELDGSETYDYFYAFDTRSVFEKVRDGIAQRDRGPMTDIRGDRPMVERVASPDSRDRAAVEAAYAQADRAQRRSLLEAALQHGDTASVDLLRLGIFGLDEDLAELARQALAKNGSAAAVDLIADTLGTPVPADQREALVAALDRLGAVSPRARTLSTVHRGIRGGVSVVDVDGWTDALQAEYSPAPMEVANARDERLARQTEVLQGDDANRVLELAEAFLIQAREVERDERQVKLLLMDARNTAREAQRRGAQSWRVDAVLSLAAWYLGDSDESYALAATAVAALPPGDPSWNSMAVLDLFARLRWKEIVEAVRAKQDWPPQYLTDIHAACSVLVKHPLGTDAQVVWHYDRLKWLGAKGQAARVLDEGLARFADSADLHDRLRSQILADQGPAGLATVYDAMAARADASQNLAWYAGYAALVAAEYQRRAGRPDAALSAYDRGIAHYEAFLTAHPEQRDGADHYIAVALAGRARIAFERDDNELAQAELLRSFRRRPDAAATLDGLNISAVGTAQLLLARLKQNGEAARAGELQAALDALDPAMLAPPAFETENPPPSRGGRPGRQRPGADGDG